jgi:hypothetical protein
MTKLTKELIEEALKKCDAYHGAVTAPVSVDVVRAMARQLLAGLEQEPVGITDRSEIEGLKRGEMANVMPPDFKGVDAGDEVLLYAAPQLPQPAVVPPAIEPDYEVIKRILPTANPDEYACCIAADMWNACRAAMLEAAPQQEVK